MHRQNVPCELTGNHPISRERPVQSQVEHEECRVLCGSFQGDHCTEERLIVKNYDWIRLTPAITPAAVSEQTSA